MKRFICMLLIIFVLISNVSVFAETNENCDIILYALESEYVLVGDTVQNSNAVPFMYKNQSYVPVRYTVEALGGEITKVSSRYLNIFFKGKEYTLYTAEDKKMVSHVTYMPAKSISSLLGLTVLWNNGLVGYSAKGNVLYTEQEVEDIKFRLGFVTYNDRYNIERELYSNSVMYLNNGEYRIVNGNIEKISEKPFVKNEELYVPLVKTAESLGGICEMLDTDGNYSIKYNYKNYYFTHHFVIYEDDVAYAPISDIAREMGIKAVSHNGFYEITGYPKSYSNSQTEGFLYALENGSFPVLEEAKNIVKFSKTGGLYTSEFNLKLETNAENAVIYYTTDGSDPDINSTVYQNEILIKNRSEDENKISMYSNIVKEGFTAPNGKIFKGTVVKARAILPDGTMGPIVQNSYFVSPSVHSRYIGAKVISISTDENNLFGENGIYVYPNYQTVGNPNEVEAYMEVFDEEGNSTLSQTIGLRLNGAGSRELQQKALRLYARENPEFLNGTSKTFRYDFFDGTAKDVNGNIINENKRIILRNAGDDWSKYYLRDTLSQGIAKKLGLDFQAYSPAVVFINGEYWGVHFIRERYDNHYFKYHYNLKDKSDVIMIEIANDPLKATLSEGNGAEDLEVFNSEAYFIINNDMTVEENYKKAQTLFDLDNMIDFYIANIFLENVDWPHNNIKIWKNKNPENTTVDTRWRFVLADMDVTMESLKVIYSAAFLEGDERLDFWKQGNGGSIAKKLDAECISNFMFNKLLENKNFKSRFIAKYLQYIDTVFSASDIKNQINSRFNLAIHLRNEQVLRYPKSWTYTDTIALKTWADERGEIAKQELINYFGLSKTGKDIKITATSDLNEGRIILNGVSNDSIYAEEDIVEMNTKKGYPITFKAVPNEGYEFCYFDIDDIYWHKNEYTTNPGGNMTIKAVFKKTETPSAKPTI